MSFVDYLESAYRTKRVAGGREIQILDGPCPFCGTERRSDLRMYVSADEEKSLDERVGYCHHCPRGFSAVEFVAAAEKVSKDRARKLLGGDDSRYAKTVELAEEAEELIYPQVFPITDYPSAWAYCQGRGITLEMIQHFDLGYCPFHTERPDGSLIYTKSRIIFPIKDREGKVVSWQGRDITGEARMKYLFPDRFTKSKFLYNCNAIKKGPAYLILSEGVMHCLGWTRAGLKSVVGTFGKSVSHDQLEIIADIQPQVLFVALDSDAHWDKYTFVEAHGHMFPATRIVDLDGKDADEMTRAALKAALVNSKSYDWNDKILGML